jgi:thioredoxin 1
MKASRSGFNPNYEGDAPTLQQVGELHGDAIIEFGAPWCGHCLAAQVVVQEVLGEYLELPHIKVHDSKGKRLGRAFRVKRWPTLIMLHDGKEVGRLVRPLQANEVRELLLSTAGK